MPQNLHQISLKEGKINEQLNIHLKAVSQNTNSEGKEKCITHNVCTYIWK